MNEEETVKLMGFIRSEDFGLDKFSLNIGVKPCTGQSLSNKNCKTSSQISNWVQNKMIQTIILNEEADLSSFDDPIIVKETRMPAVQLSSYIASLRQSQTLEMRLGQLTRINSWFSIASSTFNYTNVVLEPGSEGTWTYNAGASDDTDENKIYSFNMGLSLDFMQSKKAVIQFDYFLGIIAGVFPMLVLWMRWVFGGYVRYVSRLQWSEQMFKFKMNDADRPKNCIVEHDGILECSRMNLFYSYVKHKSVCARCCT